MTCPGAALAPAISPSSWRAGSQWGQVAWAHCQPCEGTGDTGTTERLSVVTWHCPPQHLLSSTPWEEVSHPGIAEARVLWPPQPYRLDTPRRRKWGLPSGGWREPGCRQGSLSDSDMERTSYPTFCSSRRLSSWIRLFLSFRSFSSRWLIPFFSSALNRTTKGSCGTQGPPQPFTGQQMLLHSPFLLLQ